MQVLILCGGRGTRLNGPPILSHVMSIYAAQGFDDFLLLTGYRRAVLPWWPIGQPSQDGSLETAPKSPLRS